MAVLQGEPISLLEGIPGYDYPPSRWRQLRNKIVTRLKKVIQGALYVGIGSLAALAYLKECYAPTPPLDLQTVQKILVIRLDLMGDVVMSLPAVHALRQSRPDTQIDMLVLAYTAGLLFTHPEIDHVLIYDPNIWRRPNALLHWKNYREFLQLISRLRQEHYDLGLSLCGLWASVICYLSGARHRLGYAAESYPFLLTQAVSGGRYKTHKHEVDYIVALAEACGATVEEKNPRLPVPTRVHEQMADLLATQGVAPGDLLIGMHVGSNNGLAKRWPLLHWAKLAEQMIRRGAKVAFTGATGDLPLIRAVLAALPASLANQVIITAGKTGLPELVALLARCQLVISGDSGPMHIAEAVGTPVIAIHGPTDPVHSGPYGDKAIVLRKALFCSPCYNASASAECRFFNPICMKHITPTEVYRAAEQLLGA